MIVYVLTQLGGLAMNAQEWTEAEKAYGEALDTVATDPEKNRDAGSDLLNGYSTSVEMQKRPADAEPRRRKQLELARSADSPVELATALANLGRNLVMQKRWAEAEQPLREALELRRKSLAGDDAKSWQIETTAGMLGEAIFERAAAESSAALFAEAEPLVESAATALPGNANVPKPGPGMPDRKREAIDRAVRFYTEWRKVSQDEAHAEKAKNWQTQLSNYDESE